MTRFDVYSYGMVSTSTLHILNGNFPAPDAYAEIKDTFRMVGGEAANSSIVLSQLGVQVKLDGNWLGQNENGRQTLTILKSFNLNTERLRLKEDYHGVEEIVFADGNTRTNFSTYCHLLFNEQQWNNPVAEDIRQAEVVCLDPFFKAASLEAAALCHAFQKPYVTIDCSYTSELARDATVVIISGEFRKNEYRERENEELFRCYTQQAKGLVVFTAGGAEVLYGRSGEAMQRFTPFPIKPVDTAGAGDSFRSGIIYGLLQKWPETKTIRFASALAACICESFPGVLNAPRYPDLLNYFRQKNWQVL